MTSQRRYSADAANLVLLLAAIGGYFFSISEASFAWRFPDEILAHDVYSDRGLIGCTGFYYLETTIQRIGNAFGVCMMSAGAEFFDTRYLGWVSMRLLTYALFPISIASLLQRFTKVSFTLSLVVALIISAVSLFILSDTNGRPFYMFGLDLTAYGTACFSFFFLLALFPRMTENNYYFVLFSFLFLLNTTSQEVFLIISGFIIPIYVLYYNQNASLKKPAVFIDCALKDKKVWILSLLWLVAALTTIFSPSFERRQTAWPSSGTVSDGLLYVALTIEETAYFLYQSLGFVILVFLLGMLLRCVAKYKHATANNMLFVLLFSAPVMYVLIVPFLAGITPFYWTMPLRPEEFQFVGDWLSDEPTGHKGALGVRQNLFLFLSLYLNIFLAGFFTSGSRVISRDWICKAGLGMTLVVIFLFHPDGIGSARILHALAKENFNLESYTPRKNEAGPHSLIEKIFPESYTAVNIGNIFFKRARFGQHESVVASIAVNNHLIANKGKYVPPEVLDHIYMGSRMPMLADWRRRIYEAYGVINKPDEIFYLQDEPGRGVSNTYGKAELEKILQEKKTLTPWGLYFNYLVGTQQKGKKHYCRRLVDKSVAGEHYMAAKDFPISEGFGYFVFEALPTATELYIKVIGQKTHILFPWSLKGKNVEPWKISNIDEGLYPVFRQNEDNNEVQKLKFVVYSAVNQKLEIRWQHGQEGKINYTGNEKNISYPCFVYFGPINK